MNRRPWLDRVRVGVLALVAFVLAHGAVYLATYGSSYDAVLARTGHGGPWEATVATVLGLAAALATLSAIRLVVLAREANRLGPGVVHPAGGGLRALARSTLGAWPVVFGGSLLLFVGVENLEHVSAGLTAPGLSVLGSPDYHGALAIIAAVALLVAAVEGLYRWRRDTLIARIAAAAGARRIRSAPAPRRRFAPWLDPRLQSMAGHHVAGRAPPAAVA